MKKYDTKLAVHIGDDSYPIYLIVRGDDFIWKDGKYDLWCEHEIYALAWFDIYNDAVKDYNDGKLEEVNVKN